MVELEVVNIPKSITSNMEFVGNILFWIVMVVFGLWVFAKFFSNIGALREEMKVDKIGVKPATAQ